MISSRASIDPEAVIDSALSLRDSGRGAEAIAPLKAALAIYPRNARLWQTLGVVHRALDRSAEAVTAFAEASRLAPGDLKAVYGIAQSSLEAGRPSVALFDQARAIAPGDGSPLIGRVAALLAEGRGEEAIDFLDAIVRDNPLWSDGQATLARLRWMMGDAEHFAAGYERALTRAPTNVQLWTGLLDMLVHTERYDRAAAVATDARRATGVDTALLPFEAVCASELGEIAAADALFARLAPHADIGIVERHLRHLLRTHRADAASALAESWLARPSAGQLWPYVSLAWRMTGDRRIDWLEGDPALVGVYDLDGIADLLAPLADRLRALHLAKRDPLGQSVRGGTQTDGPLFAHEAPEIQALRAMLVESVEQHIGTMGKRDPGHPTLRHVGKRFRFAGAWSVRLTGAGHHSNHVHPQGWLSSAFYVEIPTQAEMGPPPAGWLGLGAPPAELSLDMAPLRHIEPKPGRLVLFPSTMWHGTMPITGGERLTVAFDVAAIG